MKIPSLKKIMKSSDVAVVAPVVKKAPTKKATTKVAKKAPPKKVAGVAKKAPAKKTAPKKTAAKRLVVASDSESFWVTNGHVLNSLVALEMALQSMTKEVYEYHISNTGSDFADWVEAVLMAPGCASELRKAKTAKAAYLVVVQHLKDHTV